MNASRGEKVKAPAKYSKSAWHPYYWIIVAVTVYIAFEAYTPALNGPFVYDDFGLPFYNRFFPVERLTAWISGVCPLLMLSYWFNFELSGRTTYSYHLVNLFLHLANTAAVYLIVNRLLAWEGLDRSQREIYAVFAGLLFLLHPVQTESVASIAGRSESLSALFFLYAFIVFIYRSSNPIGWRRSILILVLFACALSTKEHTITLPIILLFTDFFWAREDPAGMARTNWRLYLLMLLAGLLAGGFIWNLLNNSPTAGLAIAGVRWPSYALTQCRVFFVYLRLFLFPVDQNIDYDVPWSSSPFTLGTIAGFVGIVTLTAVAWHLRHRFPVGSYGFLIFLILLAPTSSFIPIKDPIAEHRLYLPIVGLLLVACEFLIQAVKEPSSAMAFACILILSASIATYRRNHLWGSEAALWEDTVAKSPNKLRGYAHLVHGYVSEHRCREALQRLDEWSRRMTLDATLLEHWAFAYECVHERENALAKLEQSVAESPRAGTYVNIARNQLLLGREEDALQSLKRALERDSTLESAYVMRGELYERLRNHSAAASDYRRALELNPRDERVQWRLQHMH